MKNIVNTLTKETIKTIYKEINNKQSQKKITYIIDKLVGVIMNKISPYLYVIIAILIIFILTNFIQFFYYIKIYTQSSNFNENIFN